MLKHENYTSEHIAALKSSTGADPSILERTVFAFGLLEAIRHAFLVKALRLLQQNGLYTESILSP